MAAQELEEAAGGRDEAHVRRAGLGDDRGDVAAVGRRRERVRSFQGTTTVAAAVAAGTPGLAGIPCVASPEPAAASSPSEWPW